MRRPRAGFVTPHSGGSGPRPSPTTRRLRGARCTGAVEAFVRPTVRLTREGRRQKRDGRRNGNRKRGPGDRKAANGAPEGVVRRSPGARRAFTRAALQVRHPALHPLAFGGGNCRIARVVRGTRKHDYTTLVIPGRALCASPEPKNTVLRDFPETLVFMGSGLVLRTPRNDKG